MSVKLPEAFRGEPEWFEEEDPTAIATKMLSAVVEAEKKCFEWIADGFVYQMFASGRRIQNIYGLTATQSGGFSYSIGRDYGAFQISIDNQIAIGIETLVATVGAVKPWCHFATTDGDWGQRIRAKRKGDFLYSLMKTCGFYTDLPNYFRDMLTWGWGISKRVIVKRGKEKVIESRRCVPSEVLWNRAYSLIPGKREPIYHRTFALRSDLARDFPDHAEAIYAAPGAASGNLPGLTVETPQDFVTVCEGWYPSQDGVKPGVHVLSVGETLLNDGKTKMDPDEDHPFTFLVGYNIGPDWQYQGVVEQVLGDQWELNTQNSIIRENQKRGAQNRWLIHDKAAVDTGSLLNRAAQITKWSGSDKPELVTYQFNPPELYQDRDKTRQRILTRMGVNQFAAMGTKPADLNSGEALREYGDHAQQRHRTLAENLETFVVDTGRKLIWACEKVKPKMQAPGRRSVKMLDWEKVKLPPGSYSVELAFPISSLPRTPEGLVDKAN